MLCETCYVYFKSCNVCIHVCYNSVFFAVLTFKQPTERATKKKIKIFCKFSHSEGLKIKLSLQNVPVQNVPNTPVWGPQSTCLSRLRTGQSDLSVAGFWIPTLALSSCA